MVLFFFSKCHKGFEPTGLTDLEICFKPWQTKLHLWTHLWRFPETSCIFRFNHLLQNSFYLETNNPPAVKTVHRWRILHGVPSPSKKVRSATQNCPSGDESRNKRAHYVILFVFLRGKKVHCSSKQQWPTFPRGWQSGLGARVSWWEWLQRKKKEEETETVFAL